MTRRELIDSEIAHEKARDFHTHLNNPSMDGAKKVTEQYDYLRGGFFNRLGSVFAVGLFRLIGLFVGPYCHFKVEGKKNLKEIRSAIVTSNHINNCDCILIRRSAGHRKLRITVAEFNNPKGIGGAILRAGGTLPIGSTLGTMRHLNTAISELLKKKCLVLFYPEGSLWWCYEKPRPFIDGAFLTAKANSVPVVPMFYTFKKIGTHKDGTDKKAFTLHIGEPIYPDSSLSHREDVERMRDLVFAFNKKTYEEAYGIPLEYLPEEKEN